MRKVTRAAAVVAALLLAAGVTASSHAQVHVHSRQHVPGEAGRLLERMLDWAYHADDGNVYRNSRHAHPTQNPFRSSRHYRQKVASSWDGYPVRTFVRFDSRAGHGPRVAREYSYAHHGRIHGTGLLHGFDFRPCGHALTTSCDCPETAPVTIVVPVGVDAAGAGAPTPAARPAPPPRRPTERAVLREVREPDGTVRTVITSEPIDADLDAAWRLLEDGDPDEAADRFARLSFDRDRAVEASIGYALAAAQLGDVEAATAALQRAGDLDRVILTSGQRQVVETSIAAVNDEALRGELERLR